MKAYIERWLAAAASVRGGRVALPLILVLLIAGDFWLSAPSPPLAGDGHPGLRQQWLRLIPLQAALQSDIADEPKTPIFSPITLPVAGATLMAWRPAGRSGEMLLAVRWQAVPALFSWLADCGMRATAFSLRPEKGTLQLTLQLEAEDAE
ncbi:pilus assembly protein HofO [Raoultella sp. BIGb0138]|uniref:HofO family protein n=1 Tax=Raoultella sp. BIGb0138 TaxID=2485115 RepID=UPI0010433F10|nr:hypothetical protein [Raoultella sp. BIGb0138]TCW06032.1 pilus assembly protein HofO [Raoultella sp. BIGb0138]